MYHGLVYVEVGKKEGGNVEEFQNKPKCNLKVCNFHVKETFCKKIK